MVEDTKTGPDSSVAVLNPVKAGKNVRRAGEDIQPGKVLLKAGDEITPARLGMLAMNGRFSIEVFRRPVVAIMSTGDELVDIDMEPGPGQIVNTNSHTLRALLLECGALPFNLSTVADNPETTRRALERALFADVIITSGGVSMGDYDFVKDIITELGVDVKFWKVKVKPGKPTIFGTHGPKLFFGLPGNPVSVMVTFEQYVRPALLKMQGFEKVFRPVIRARLEEDVKNKAGRTNLMRCRIERKSDHNIARLTGEQGSGILSSMAWADGLIIIPHDATLIPAGQEVEVQLLHPERFYAE